MDKPHNHSRIVTIHQMLFEMARGNFNSRIPLITNNDENDELETLIVLINMVAEEMKESIFNFGLLILIVLISLYLKLQFYLMKITPLKVLHQN